MTNSYANYFCQKFYAMLTVEDRCQFLLHIKDRYFLMIATDKIGTYPLQYIIEMLNTTKEKQILIECIRNSVYELSMDTQGTHVIEKIILTIEESKLDFIFYIIVDRFMELANNINGLCVCKKSIVHSNNPDTLEALRDKICNNALDLIQNPFGNYVIQTAYEVFYTYIELEQGFLQSNKFSLLWAFL